MVVLIFYCNDARWTIEIVSEKTMDSVMKNKGVFGATFPKSQEIYIVEDQANPVKTLKHELMHVWLYEYGYACSDRSFDIEDICEITSSSNNFVNRIIKKFEKEGSKDANSK